jgi:hypothetical protein
MHAPLSSAVLLAMTCALAACTHEHTPAHAQMHAERTAEVAQRGGHVMPFDLAATVHVFTRLDDGGVQRVVARQPGDSQQVTLVRAHLRDIRGQFLASDFSGPAHIHGTDMPGLAELQAAAPGQLDIAYRDVEGGAELHYTTRDLALVAAVHRWFDAQLSDHGPDAMAGHDHGHDHGHTTRP